MPRPSRPVPLRPGRIIRPPARRIVALGASEVIVGPLPTGLSRSRAWIVWLALALATLVGLLVLGRHLTFWQDEWAFIGADPSRLADFLEPHNEHWSTVPLILYRGVLAVVGLHSYLPYLAVLALLHVAAAGGAFVLLMRRLPGWAALLAVIPLLVLGSGFEASCGHSRSGSLPRSPPGRGDWSSSKPTNAERLPSPVSHS